MLYDEQSLKRKLRVNFEFLTINNHLFQSHFFYLVLLLTNSETAKLKVDPQLLFQRLPIVANSSNYSMDDLLKYERSSQPTALFDNHGLLCHANKPQLTDVLSSSQPSDESKQSSDCQPVYNVLNGGSLLQRFPWKRVKLLTQ